MGVLSTNDITISYEPSIGACDKILSVHQLKRSYVMNGDVPKKRRERFLMILFPAEYKISNVQYALSCKEKANNDNLHN